ncbi:MAG: efflux RND transporter periplasmic adaptor subunit [Candidatus Ozemobacteraceae bacterium]
MSPFRFHLIHQRVINHVCRCLLVPGLLSGILLLNGCAASAPPLPANRLGGNGVIEAIEVDLTAKIPGKIASMTIREGEEIFPGQRIADLEAREYEGQLRQAEAAVKTARSRLDELLAGTRPEEIRRARAQLEAASQAIIQAEARVSLVEEGPRKEQVNQARAGVSQADTTLNDAETELNRVDRLEKVGAVARQQVDLARTRRDLARAQLVTAHERLREALNGSRPQERNEAVAALAGIRAQREAASATLDLAIAGPRFETIAAARAQLEQAEGALLTASATMDQAVVFAPCRGRVTLRNAEPGELITPGMPILRVAQLHDIWLRVYVSETDIDRIKLGQHAEVLPDAVPDRRFKGKVSEISDKPEFTPRNVQTRAERTKLVFGVKISVENPDFALKPGMPADAEIEVGP